MQVFIEYPLAPRKEILVIPSIQSTNGADFLPSQKVDLPLGKQN